jgi:hypothetical protein
MGAQFKFKKMSIPVCNQHVILSLAWLESMKQYMFTALALGSGVLSGTASFASQ